MPQPETEPDTPASATVTDHPFQPRGAWWSLCKHCGLAEPAHAVRPPDLHTAPTAPAAT